MIVGRDARKKMPRLPTGEPVAGVLYQTLAVGERMMVTTMQYEKGTVVPLHVHGEEQAGYVVRGRLVLCIDDQTVELREGDSYSIQGDTPHSIRAESDALVVDVFSPPRLDYLDPR